MSFINFYYSYFINLIFTIEHFACESSNRSLLGLVYEYFTGRTEFFLNFIFLNRSNHSGPKWRLSSNKHLIYLKPTIHDATKLHATVACNFVALCMLNFPCNKVANNIVASCMLKCCVQLCYTVYVDCCTQNCCMEIEHVQFSCNIVAREYGTSVHVFQIIFGCILSFFHLLKTIEEFTCS